MIIAGVWFTSALYSVPKFIFVHTVDNDLGNGRVESICIMNRKMYDSKLFDLINFGILYIIPLLVISVSGMKLSPGIYWQRIELSPPVCLSLADPVQPNCVGVVAQQLRAGATHRLTKYDNDAERGRWLQPEHVQHMQLSVGADGGA